MKAEILNRKGPRKAENITKEVLHLLNKGLIESVNLTEWLAVDHVKLMQTNFKTIGISEKITKNITQEIKNQKKPSTMNSVKLIGTLLSETYVDKNNYLSILSNLSTHISDSIRCYAPYLISLNKNLTIEEKLAQFKSLAGDKHFGVREVAWMSLRPELDKTIKKSIRILTKWATDKDENVRRFATESIRPRGVWCKHIDALKENPELALPILKKLKSDQSKYVQNSVGNWLNDASKSKPDFVIDLCEKWNKESPTKETENIIKRARRTIDKI